MSDKSRRSDAERFFRRVLPKSMIGLSTLLFFMSLAAAFSGAALFAYYRFELNDTEQRVSSIESSVADDLEAAQQILDGDTKAATDEIEQLLTELEQFAATGKSVTELLDEAKGSIFLVTTLDENGQPSVGTAFVLFSDSERSYLLTSYNTVRAATVSPGPAIKARQGSVEVAVDVNGWDDSRDLALLVAEDAPNLPALEIGRPSSVNTGDRVFALSALGSDGGAIVQGFIADVASNGIQHDAPVGVQFQGGPMLNAKGEVIGIASRTYSPLGFRPDTVFFGVPILQACEKVVQCPSSLTG